MRWRDTAAGYGLTSILLHWLSAVFVIAMLAIGNGISASVGGDRLALIAVHTSIGLLAYPAMLFRVYWRVRSGHPGALSRQKRALVKVAAVVHYILVGSIALMLLTGPVVAWSGAIPLQLFDWAIPSPIGNDYATFGVAHALHVAGASVLLGLVVLHIAAALFHIMFQKDRTLDKILIPAADRVAHRDP